MHDIWYLHLAESEVNHLPDYGIGHMAMRKVKSQYSPGFELRTPGHSLQFFTVL